MARRIKKGDQVIVLAGAEKGRTGRVVRVEPEKNRVYIDGLAMQFKHVRRSQQNPKGGRITREGPVHISNVALFSADQSVGQRFKVEERDKGRVRVGVRDGAELD
jgi:large subunit ribosomal protein L24